jgi:hypothetical protein
MAVEQLSWSSGEESDEEYTGEDECPIFYSERNPITGYRYACSKDLHHPWFVESLPYKDTGRDIVRRVVGEGSQAQIQIIVPSPDNPQETTNYLFKPAHSSKRRSNRESLEVTRCINGLVQHTVSFRGGELLAFSMNHGANSQECMLHALSTLDVKFQESGVARRADESTQDVKDVLAKANKLVRVIGQDEYLMAVRDANKVVGEPIMNITIGKHFFSVRHMGAQTVRRRKLGSWLYLNERFYTVCENRETGKVIAAETNPLALRTPVVTQRISHIAVLKKFSHKELLEKAGSLDEWQKIYDLCPVQFYGVAIQRNPGSLQ